ncbi:MAG TPA: hypothetical protein VHS99_04920 [Chloroflexota bacterium]|jgi:cytochrome c biogenesis protein CcdA|nr:hypothetical protein [Chloroflexota bacterium]
MDLAPATQLAQQAGGIAFLGAALTLGLRHGIDWDHLAAIADITGTTAGMGAGGRRAMASRPGGRAGARPVTAGGVTASGITAGVSHAAEGSARRVLRRRAVWLASLYALGHALVVVVLGLAALHFQAILPEWIDPIMERVVGVTLLLLGFWLVYALVRYWRGEGDLQLRSRWMLLLAGSRRVWHSLQERLHGHRHDGAHAGFHVHRVGQYGPRTAFGTGLVHGIGAETGTQVLIIAAVGGAAGQSAGLGTGMLLAFVLGLLISNTAVALLATTGFLSVRGARVLYLGVACLAAGLSLVIGTYAVLGVSDRLPALQ